MNSGQGANAGCDFWEWPTIRCEDDTKKWTVGDLS